MERRRWAPLAAAAAVAALAVGVAVVAGTSGDGPDEARSATPATASPSAPAPSPTASAAATQPSPSPSPSDDPSPAATPSASPAARPAPTAGASEQPSPAAPAPSPTPAASPSASAPARAAFSFDAAYGTDEPYEVVVQYGDSSSCPHEQVTHAVDESRDRVVVTLEAVAQEPGRACTADYRQRLVPVRLQQPLGDRVVVDGSRGEPVPVDRSCSRPFAQPPPPKDCEPA